MEHQVISDTSAGLVSAYQLAESTASTVQWVETTGDAIMVSEARPPSILDFLFGVEPELGSGREEATKARTALIGALFGGESNL